MFPHVCCLGVTQHQGSLATGFHPVVGAVAAVGAGTETGNSAGTESGNSAGTGPRSVSLEEARIAAGLIVGAGAAVVAGLMVGAATE